MKQILLLLSFFLLVLPFLVTAQNLQADSINNVYHIEDSALYVWKLQRYKEHPELKVIFDTVYMDSIRRVMARRHIRKYNGYTPPGYVNQCDKMANNRIDEIIRYDTLHHKGPHTIEGVIKHDEDD